MSPIASCQNVVKSFFIRSQFSFSCQSISHHNSINSRLCSFIYLLCINEGRLPLLLKSPLFECRFFVPKNSLNQASKYLCFTVTSHVSLSTWASDTRSNLKGPEVSSLMSFSIECPYTIKFITNQTIE